MKEKILIVFVLLLVNQSCFAQDLTQIIRGVVIDQQTGIQIPGATVILLNSSPINGTTTDLNGYFSLTNIPLGRQSIQITFIGYQPAIIRDLVITSGKELNLNIKLLESATKLNEVVIKSEKNNDKPINELAIVSARSFTLDQATRFAGAFNDPARMAANFAGVTSSADLRNDIIVRGNSPNAVIYRIEGIPTPNPNHFGGYGESGGAISMISQNILDNSDFLTGAFPSEYGNSIGGVFDINMRNGNHHKREYSAQMGFRGLEFTAEGPFSKNSKGSYLVNYRYSTFEILDALGLSIGVPATPRYQDLSFKIDLPTGKKIGRFTLFGIGGTASIDLKDSEEMDPKEFFSQDKPANVYNKTSMGIIGLSNFHIFSKRTTGKLTILSSYSEDNYQSDTLNAPDFKTPVLNAKGDFLDLGLSVNYKIKHKINSRNLISSGVITRFSQLSFKEQNTVKGVYGTSLDHKGDMQSYQVYADWQHRFSDKLILNIGTHYMHFSMTKSDVIEPRTALKWQIDNNQSINAGFGIHSQGLVPYAYFITEQNKENERVFKNRNLGLMKSLHYVLGYSRSLTENIRLKTELYYQDLYDIPVEKNASAFSVINTGNDFEGFPDDKGILENKGTGKNYGVEITLEKSFSNQTYFMLTTSLFDSKYKGSDGIERNTAFNQNYVFNLLGGKEWKVGKSKNNVLSLNCRINWIGGRRYTPIDREQSLKNKMIVYYEDKTYENKYDDYFRADLKLSYIINRSKLSHQVSIDIQNLTNQQNLFQENYNLSSNSFSKEYQQGFVPELQYKITF